MPSTLADDLRLSLELLDSARGQVSDSIIDRAEWVLREFAVEDVEPDVRRQA